MMLQGNPFSSWKSYYVDDDAYLFLSRKDIEDALKLIKSYFTCFGLTTHSCGDRRNNGNLKSEAMFFPPPGKSATARDYSRYMI